MIAELPTALDHFVLGILVGLLCVAIGMLLGRGLVTLTLKLTDTAPERPSSMPGWRILSVGQESEAARESASRLVRR